MILRTLSTLVPLLGTCVTLTAQAIGNHVPQAGQTQQAPPPRSDLTELARRLLQDTVKSLMDAKAPPPTILLDEGGPIEYGYTDPKSPVPFPDDPKASIRFQYLPRTSPWGVKPPITPPTLRLVVTKGAAEKGDEEVVLAELKAKDQRVLNQLDLKQLAPNGRLDIQIKQIRHAADRGEVVATIPIVFRGFREIVIGPDGPIDAAYRTFETAAYLGNVSNKTEVTFRYVGEANGPPLVIRSLELSRTAPHEPLTYRIDPPGNTDKLPSEVKLNVDTLNAEYVRNDRLELLIYKYGQPIAPTALTFTLEPDRKPALSRTEQINGVSARVYTVLLDRTGVTSWQFLNRRQPAHLSPPEASARPSLAAGIPEYLRIRNLLSDRVFAVTFSGLPESSRAEFLAHGVRLTECKDAKCDAILQVPEQNTRLVPLQLLRTAYVKNGVAAIATLKVAFFDDDAEPTNSRGYFTIAGGQAFAEAGSVTTWTVAGSATYSYDPDLTFVASPGKSPSITFLTPREGQNRNHVSGSATVAIRQNLGSRADAEVELTAKRGDLGLLREPPTVQATKYFLNIYSFPGLTFTGGRFDVAAPSQSIAAQESGEAINATFRLGRTSAFGGAGWIFRKELPRGRLNLGEEALAVNAGAQDLDGDHSTLVLQVRDVWSSNDRLRLSLFGSYGRNTRGQGLGTDEERELVKFSRRYYTAGGEALWPLPVHPIRLVASAAFYHNRRWLVDAEPLERTDATSGNVSLITVTYTNLNADIVEGRRLVDFSVTGTVGRGTHYVGENQNFTPDSIFLSQLTPVINELRPPGVGPNKLVGPGLTDKWYVGLIATTPRFPLPQFAKVFGAPTSDVGSRGTTLKLHYYRLRVPTVEDHKQAGFEMDWDFRIESPKGVRYLLTWAYFWPGKALTGLEANRLVTHRQWLFRSTVTIKLQ